MKLKLYHVFAFFYLMAGSIQADAIGDQLRGHLIRIEGGKIQKKASFSNQNPKYYLLYFSAHWCPPCRPFTAELVQYYQRLKPKYSSFEIVLISQDETEKEMIDYMRKSKMPWPAVDFKDIKSMTEVMKYVGRGLPSLIAVDREGKVLSDSFIDGKYRGPEPVLQEFEEILKRDNQSGKNK